MKKLIYIDLFISIVSYFSGFGFTFSLFFFLFILLYGYIGVLAFRYFKIPVSKYDIPFIWRYL